MKRTCVLIWGIKEVGAGELVALQRLWKGAESQEGEWVAALKSRGKQAESLGPLRRKTRGKEGTLTEHPHLL